MEEAETKILWQIESCPLCLGRYETEPVCHLAVGLLQEFLYWVSSGKVFHVEETACIACGDATCTIEVEKNPIS